MNNKYLEVQQTLVALEKEVAFLNWFYELNPRWCGGTVADVLSALEDADAHLDVTEPIYKELSHRCSVCELIVPCTYALIYSERKPPTPAEVMDLMNEVKLFRERSHYRIVDTMDYVKSSLNQNPFGSNDDEEFNK